MQSCSEIDPTMKIPTGVRLAMFAQLLKLREKTMKGGQKFQKLCEHYQSHTVRDFHRRNTINLHLRIRNVLYANRIETGGRNRTVGVDLHFGRFHGKCV